MENRPSTRMYRYSIPLLLALVLPMAFAQDTHASDAPASSSREAQGLEPPIDLLGPGVNSNDFRVTIFASGLDFPMGLAELSDGSLLVTVSDPVGSSFNDSVGTLVRFVDADDDGVADGPGSVLFTGLPGTQTGLRLAGDLVFVMNASAGGNGISILRAGGAPGDALTLEGTISFTVPVAYHIPSSLAVRATPGQANRYDLFFQVGAEFNDAASTSLIPLTSDIGLSGSLHRDSVYKLTVTDQGSGVAASGLVQLATGLRNAAGLVIDPETGDLWFIDNGIDGPNSTNLSADELNRIEEADLGGLIEDFGFPDNYVVYTNGAVVGGAGVLPVVPFVLLMGEENEGAASIAFSPKAFPPRLDNGIFVGFHGKFSSAGLNNEENPLVYVDTAARDFFHFIGVNEPGIGHLDGLLATDDSLFLADLTAAGNISSGAGAGAIYQIKSNVIFLRLEKTAGEPFELHWDAGILQGADEATGAWTDVPGAVSPYAVPPGTVRRLYRVRN